MLRAQQLTTKIFLHLPIVVGKMVVQGAKPNSVCGLSFICYHGKHIADELNLLEIAIKITKTHHQHLPAAAYCCWQDSGVRWKAKLSL